MRTDIDPKRTYTATDIVKQRLLPWARSYTKVAEVLASGILKAKSTGESTQKRYFVAGKDLLGYIKKYGPALIGTAYKKRENNGGENKACKRLCSISSTPGRPKTVR